MGSMRVWRKFASLCLGSLAQVKRLYLWDSQILSPKPLIPNPAARLGGFGDVQRKALRLTQGSGLRFEHETWEFVEILTFPEP